MAEIQCVRCGERGEQLPKPPLRNELGERVFASIDRACWDEWLQYQQALINHYGLDVRQPQARQFLTRNMEAYLFKTEDPEDIDTSQEGSIAW
ncbi:MAG: oxidative damage protection protein [Gemmatimonadota bacterium]